jgi:hypothetical protein
MQPTARIAFRDSPVRAVMVKRSPGSKMKTIVNALERAPSRQNRATPSRGIGLIECFTG